MNAMSLMSIFYGFYALANRLCVVRMFLRMNLNVHFGLCPDLVLLVVSGMNLDLIAAIIFITILVGFLTLALLYPFCLIYLMVVTHFFNLVDFFLMSLQSNLRMEFLWFYFFI